MGTLAGKKVLIVEDEAGIARNLRAMLTDLGCTVLGPAGTVEAALGIALSSKIDAALLDIKIQAGESSEIARVLQTRGVPFLVVTAFPEERNGRFGSAPVLVKPYHQEDLEEALGQLFT